MAEVSKNHCHLCRPLMMLLKKCPKGRQTIRKKQGTANQLTPNRKHFTCCVGLHNTAPTNSHKTTKPYALGPKHYTAFPAVVLRGDTEKQCKAEPILYQSESKLQNSQFSDLANNSISDITYDSISDIAPRT